MTNCVALLSGGKDSVYTAVCLQKKGVKIECLLHLEPTLVDEKDNNSYMFQTALHEAIPYLSEAMGIPLINYQFQSNSSICIEKDYTVTENDEIEKLYEAVKKVLVCYPKINSICCGAIASEYQANRLANVAERCGITVLTPLWQKDQREVLDEIIESGLDARLVKVCSMGLNQKDIGKSLSEMKEKLIRLNKQCGASVVGEGGEFETFVFDGPTFVKRIEFEYDVITEREDDYAPVCYMRIKSLKCVAK
ncbi:ATP-binding domain containing protein, putative [Entamoeba invadens IP1]|uniref:Diphthine--ammonia ligase n=1 Tax=Entamoeba invadens IP1 TaxID=370355 RepID=A0A0A1U2D8_ENTIV|nr:ATP-binding domain containing protein, putative [Entamoeba invadens IP1]ELP88199.1 ATP-binding domain containing protein, putative [Entamoeba invadens IP1]|eukprot:XP_004254970.1 ATP-binding domain containing protein, putative [Entamoeba invadens IP1]